MPISEAQYESLVIRLRELEASLELLRSHAATHERLGGDVVNPYLLDDGTPLPRQPGMNFTTGFVLVEDPVNRWITISSVAIASRSDTEPS
jgi:hypothetical protein